MITTVESIVLLIRVIKNVHTCTYDIVCTDRFHNEFTIAKSITGTLSLWRESGQPCSGAVIMITLVLLTTFTNQELIHKLPIIAITINTQGLINGKNIATCKIEIELADIRNTCTLFDTDNLLS